MQLLVVRHGHAVPKGAWRGKDEARPLVARGERQAKSLAKTLSSHRPTKIVASPALRCQQTVEPLANARGLKVITRSALGVRAGERAVGFINDLVASNGTSTTVVLCTHREVIIDVLPALSDRFAVDLGHQLPGAKGGTWILDFRKHTLTTIRYIPPKP